MFTRELLGLFPRKRLRAVDGMAVTAEVWEEAHEYHRLLDRFHTLLYHGSGIVAGLEVIASDPADSAVYVLPGLAVDPIGQSILVPEPRAYDLGGAEGILYLILAYTESRPQSANGRGQDDAPLYVHTQYSLEAVTAPPPTPYVELARIWRQGGVTPIAVAKDPLQPRANEIDLRFRRTVGQPPQETLAIGVITLRGAEGANHGEGVANVAAAMRQSGGRVWVDRALPFNAGLERYDLICLVGRERFQLADDEMNLLYRYWQQGGTIFYESCRRTQPDGDPPGDAAFLELMSSFGVQLQPVEAGHGLMRSPYLFAVPPDGFESRGTPSLREGAGIVFSTYDFGCIWRGERRGRPAARSEIRNSLEWGANLITWAVTRRHAARQAPAQRS